MLNLDLTVVSHVEKQYHDVGSPLGDHTTLKYCSTIREGVYSEMELNCLLGSIISGVF